MQTIYFEISEDRVLSSIDLWKGHKTDGNGWFSEVQMPWMYVARVRTMPAGRGRGMATRLMREMCTDADKEDVELILVVEPDEDCLLSLEELTSWYESFGFVQTSAYQHRLVRYPSVRFVNKWKSPLTISSSWTSL